MGNFQQQGIPLENKPFDKVEKALLLTMQRLGMSLEENSPVRKLAKYHGVLTSLV